MSVVGKDVKQPEPSHAAREFFLVLFQASDRTLMAGSCRPPFMPIKRTPASVLGPSNMKGSMSGTISKMGTSPWNMAQPRAPSWFCAHQPPKCQLCPCASLSLFSRHTAGRTPVNGRWTMLSSKSTQTGTDEAAPPAPRAPDTMVNSIRVFRAPLPEGPLSTPRQAPES